MQPTGRRTQRQRQQEWRRVRRTTIPVPEVATLGTLEHLTGQNFVRLFLGSCNLGAKFALQQLVQAQQFIVGTVSQPRR